MGTGAPVNILTAVPFLTVSEKRVPAGTEPMTSSFNGASTASLERIAYPSIADTDKGGCVRLAIRSSPSTLPNELLRFTCSEGIIDSLLVIRCLASLTVIIVFYQKAL